MAPFAQPLHCCRAEWTTALWTFQRGGGAFYFVSLKGIHCGLSARLPTTRALNTANCKKNINRSRVVSCALARCLLSTVHSLHRDADFSGNKKKKGSWIIWVAGTWSTAGLTFFFFFFPPQTGNHRNIWAHLSDNILLIHLTRFNIGWQMIIPGEVKAYIQESTAPATHQYGALSNLTISSVSVCRESGSAEGLSRILKMHDKTRRRRRRRRRRSRRRRRRRRRRGCIINIHRYLSFILFFFSFSFWLQLH